MCLAPLPCVARPGARLVDRFGALHTGLEARRCHSTAEANPEQAEVAHRAVLLARLEVVLVRIETALKTVAEGLGRRRYWFLLRDRHRCRSAASHLHAGQDEQRGQDAGN